MCVGGWVVSCVMCVIAYFPVFRHFCFENIFILYIDFSSSE